VLKGEIKVLATKMFKKDVCNSMYIARLFGNSSGSSDVELENN
jgi:hypothetical protein